MADDGFDVSVGAHISGSTTAVLLRWVRGQLGPEGIKRLLELAGETRSIAEVEDLNGWSSYRQATALLEAAVQVTDRADAGRRIGEEVLTQHRGTAVLDLLRSLGSPEALLESIAESGSKFSTIFTMAASEVAPGHATVTGTTPPGVPRHRLLCDFTLGVLSSVPTVFDLAPAIVTQSQCQARGDARCVYHLTWDPTPVVDGVEVEQRVARLEDRLTGLQLQLNALRTTALDVVTAGDLDTALDIVALRAGHAVRATQYLIAVRLPGDEQPRVRAWGMTPEQVERLVPRLPTLPASSSRLVVDVASHTRHYGALVALLPGDAPFFAQERELLETYAGYAAGALDTAWALAQARRENRTARALLDLSRALAQVGTPAEVAQRLAEAVPAVVGCDHAAVLLWNGEHELLQLAGQAGISTENAATLTAGVGMPDTPALTEMLSRREPLFVHRDVSDPYLQRLLQRGSSEAAVVVPIVQGERFLGVMTAGVTRESTRLERNDDLLERLKGVAHQAATALSNAGLVDQLQQQAMRDALTGLPNRAAMFQHLDSALALAQRLGHDCALLYVDLDDFKQVNDTAGHLAGDELLVQVAQRLRSVVRHGEIVGRLGGDEFVVLLPLVTGPEEADRLAHRIMGAVAAPYRLAEAREGTWQVGASVGVAVARSGDASPSSLLRSADRAMYAVKARRRVAVT